MIRVIGYPSSEDRDEGINGIVIDTAGTPETLAEIVRNSENTILGYADEGGALLNLDDAMLRLGAAWDSLTEAFYHKGRIIKL